jgi:hypothetical protein
LIVVDKRVPLSTLRDRVDGRVRIDCCQAGVPSLFSQEEESFLVEHVKTMPRLGDHTVGMFLSEWKESEK